MARLVARLRRRLGSDEYASHLLDRLGLHVDSIDSFLWPSAGELVRVGLDVDVAIAQVDARARHFRSLLGEAAE